MITINNDDAFKMSTLKHYMLCSDKSEREQGTVLHKSKKKIEEKKREIIV